MISTWFHLKISSNMSETPVKGRDVNGNPSKIKGLIKVWDALFANIHLLLQSRGRQLSRVGNKLEPKISCWKKTPHTKKNRTHTSVLVRKIFIIACFIHSTKPHLIDYSISYLISTYKLLVIWQIQLPFLKIWFPEELKVQQTFSKQGQQLVNI